MIRLNLRKEPNVKAWLWRGLVGPASILDGIVSTVTVGTVSTGLALATSKALALSRMKM